MRAFILWSYLIFVHVFVLSAQQTSQFGDLGNGMLRNPVIPSDYSDPDIIRVGEDYYGIASTFCFSPGMIVIHSKDLVHWEIINHVVDDISFLNPELDWTQMKGYYNGVWAGSLRYHDGMFYCHFATPRGGWFVATTSDIRGKWEVKAMRDCNGRELRGRGWDDLCPLWDEDGQAYIIASNFGKYWFPHIYKMSSDGTQLLDGMIDDNCDVTKNIEIIGGYVVKPYRTAEANKLYKWNGMYYIYFSEVREIHGNKVRVPVMRRSKSIYGPYEELFSTGNIVSQRYIRWGRGEAVAKLDINKMDNGQEAGLVHFNGGKDYAYLAVVKVNGRLSLVYRSKNSKGGEQVLPLTFLPGGQRLFWLKTEIDFSGRAVFYWSLNGHKYHACGVSFQLKWGNYRGSRIGLFTYNNLQENGYIDVDYMTYCEKND